MVPVLDGEHRELLRLRIQRLAAARSGRALWSRRAADLQMAPLPANSHEPEPQSDAPGPSQPPPSAPALKTPIWALPLLAVLGGFAGAAGSYAIYRTHELYQVDPGRLGMPPYPPEILREMRNLALVNHGLGFAALGMVVCGLLSFVLVGLRSSPARALLAMALGASLGALLGAVGGAAAYLIDDALITIELDGIFKAMLIHVLNWLLLAAVLAVAAAVFMRPRPLVSELLLGVVAAAAGAALLYPLLALVFFAAAHSDRPVPFNTGLRVLLFAVGGAVLGMAAARWLRPPPVKSSAAA
jgi:hypothetical protein